ncbi:glutamine amidotransferase [Enterococcus faecium]|nr:glutamine amidotransferase [Enterococcus faecium]EGP4826327.1 glutamine amidotransferase [Enterococcus faecium]EMF0279263.1 glutamine amidotransferase [Enterococcus faecium]
MKTAITFLLEEYADWEGAYITSTLNQNEKWQNKTASIQSEVTSIGGLKTKIDYLIEQIPEKVDLFIMIGGNSWDIKNHHLYQIIDKLLKTDVPVAAICGAADYLAQSGLLQGYKHTGNAQFPWLESENYQNKEDFIEQQAVKDRNLITANGTAPIEFTDLILQAVHFETEEIRQKTIRLYKLGFYDYYKKYGDPFS